MTHPAELRLSDRLLQRLQEEADARHSSAAELAEEMLDEALKMRRFPGIVYVDGATGRRARLQPGPDVWEIMNAIRYVEGEGEERVMALAEERSLDPELIREAVAFYEAYPEEIDARVAANDEAATLIDEMIAQRERLLRA